MAQVDRPAAWIAGIYAVFGFAWVFFSDRVLAILIPDAAALTRFQTLKGTVYVLVTALLVYLLVRSALRRRARAENDLRESEARFRTIFDGVTDAIFVHDAETGAVVDVNAKTTEMFGFSRDEICRLDPTEMCAGVPPYTREDAMAWIARARQGEAPVFEWVAKRRGGSTFWVEVSMRRAEISGHLYVLVLVRDLSRRKQAEAEIRRLNEDLERRVAERTAELERANREIESFSYSVSHDLRAPLRAISGHAGMLMEGEGKALGQEAREHIKRIVANVASMSRLIEDILKFSRLSRSGMSNDKVNVESLARASLQDVAASYPNASVSVGAMPPTTGDEALLKQVFVNLLDNALKYSSVRERPEVKVGAQRFGGETVYFVEDNGVGFSMAEADRLFSVFHRLHSESEFPGTGVGLAIVKHIVERHGGRVWFESAPEQGAKFYFTIGRA